MSAGVATYCGTCGHLQVPHKPHQMREHICLACRRLVQSGRRGKPTHIHRKCYPLWRKLRGAQ